MKKNLIKGDKGEEIVIDELNKIKGRYYLINNLILLGESGYSHQFDHILIRPNGIFIIETKNYYGKIKGKIDDNMWSKSLMKKGKLINEYFLNPLKQNQNHIRYIKKILGRNIPYFNFVVFVNNDVSDLGIFNVCNLDQLLIRMDIVESSIFMNDIDMKNIYTTLLYLEADINNKDHVNNIKELKEDRKNNHKEMVMVIEKLICPKCGNRITMNKNIYFCNNCHYKLVL